MQLLETKEKLCQVGYPWALINHERNLIHGAPGAVVMTLLEGWGFLKGGTP
jgi:hypothetical protein